MQYIDTNRVANAVHENTSRSISPLKWVLDGVISAGLVVASGGAALPAVIVGAGAMAGDAASDLGAPALGEIVSKGSSLIAAKKQSSINASKPSGFTGSGTQHVSSWTDLEDIFGKSTQPGVN